jgi:hypothetical protein
MNVTILLETDANFCERGVTRLGGDERFGDTGFRRAASALEQTAADVAAHLVVMGLEDFLS